MKMRFFACLLVLAFFAAQTAFALSDAEYKTLLSDSPEFKAQDQKLGQSWKRLMSELKGEHKQKIITSQREWLKSGLDADAKHFMDSGMSKGQAYAKATHRRINVLRVIHENSQLTEKDIAEGASPLPDDFYNAKEDDKAQEADSEDEPMEIPDNCGFVKGWVEIQPGINRLTFEDGHGNVGYYFQNFEHREGEVNCGEIKGLMCFDVLGKQSVRISKKRGQIWTFIGNCRAAD